MAVTSGRRAGLATPLFLALQPPSPPQQQQQPGPQRTSGPWPGLLPAAAAPTSRHSLPGPAAPWTSSASQDTPLPLPLPPSITPGPGISLLSAGSRSSPDRRSPTRQLSSVGPLLAPAAANSNGMPPSRLLPLPSPTGGGGMLPPSPSAATTPARPAARRQSTVIPPVPPACPHYAGFVHRQTLEAAPATAGAERVPRGQLVFEAGFEGGNLQSVKRLDSGAEYELTLRQDSLNPKYRLWFHFQITNVLAHQQAVLTIINFSKTKSLLRDGMTPVVRSSSQPAWHRVPARTAYYYKSPRYNNALVLSFAVTFENEADTYELAYSFPFTYTALQYELAYLEFLGFPFLRRQQLARTPQLRRVDVLTISCPMFTCPLDHRPMPGFAVEAAQGSSGGTVVGPNQQERYAAGEVGGLFGVPPSLLRAIPGAQRRRVVFITARVHPGETPASYLAQGLINFLLGTDPEAVALRGALTWVVVPMLNPDGVFLGNYRTDAGGVDLNRMWQSAVPATLPSLHHTLQLLQSYNHHPDCQLDLFIDLHAHSTSRCSFMFCNQPRDGDNTAAGVDRVTRLPRLLDAMMPGFSLNACVFDSDAAKAGCARRVAGTLLPSTLCYTFEVSFFHCSDAVFMGQPDVGGAMGLAHSNTIEGFMEMGRQLACGIGRLYGLCAAAPAHSPHTGAGGQAGGQSPAQRASWSAGRNSPVAFRNPQQVGGPMHGVPPAARLTAQRRHASAPSSATTAIPNTPGMGGATLTRTLLMVPPVGRQPPPLAEPERVLRGFGSSSRA